MDRRQQKTRKAIFHAFKGLLKRKRYEHISVQEIIDSADVGRSTFYAHFETKDELLNALCSEMFFHVFERDPCPWKGETKDLKGNLSHILFHVQESKTDLSALFLSASGELFLDYFKRHLTDIFNARELSKNSTLPTGFWLNHLTSSFIETVKWWMNNGCKESPEEVVGYYLQANALE